MQKYCKCSHALMLKWNLGRVMGKTEPTERVGKPNLRKIHISSFPSVNGNRISALAIMKNLKNGWYFININCTEKFQITNPPTFGSLVFQVSTEMEYQCQPLWKNWKMAAISLISIIQKIANYWPPQSLGLWFSEYQWKWNISAGYYEHIGKWLQFC